MHKKTTAVGAAACLFAVPGTLLAQTAPKADDLNEEVVVTATRAGDGIRADLLGTSFTVLTPADLEQRQTRYLSDILRDVPGIAVSRSGGAGQFTQVRIRGAEGNQTLVMIDGIKASDPYAGEFDFATLIADDVAKVEVLRGQQSALYGSDAIGGVINYITLTGREMPGTRLRLEGGSFGTVDLSARTAGVAGPLDYSLSAGYQNTDGTPTARNGSRDLGSDNTAASAKLIYSVSDDARVKAVVRYSRTKADANDQDFNFPPGPNYGFVVDSPGSYYENRAVYGLLRGELDTFGGNWSHALQVQGVDAKRDGFSNNDLSGGDDGGRQRYSYETTVRFGSDAVKQSLTGALDYERETFQNRGPFLTDEQGLERSLTTKGVVAQYEAIINDRIGLGASLRYDDNSRFDSDTTYRLQGSYKLDSGTRLHAAAGSGTKNPGIFELFGFDPDTFTGNPNLKPEKSHGWEAGVEQSFLDHRARIDVTYFDNKLRDEIFTTFDANFFSSPLNKPNDSTQKGVEISLNARIGDAWSIDASYTHLDAKEFDTATRKMVEEVRRAPNIASLNVGWRGIEQRLGFDLTVRYNGAQLDSNFTLVIPTPQVRLDSFTLVDLGGDFKITDKVQLYARVENAFDEKYEEVFTFRTPGRAEYAGVRVRF
ncbi:MAG: TonB-dependent receptor [Gammaproteobacteria bacterium]